MHVHIATGIKPLRVCDMAGSSRLLAQSAKQRGKPSAMPELPWMVEGHTLRLFEAAASTLYLMLIAYSLPYTCYLGRCSLDVSRQDPAPREHRATSLCGLERGDSRTLARVN